MLIYDVSQKEGSLGVETRAYYNYDSLKLNLVQSLYRGPEVVAHSSICLTPAEFSVIISSVSKLHVANFMKKYKLD
jgi:hypothetical protein